MDASAAILIGSAISAIVAMAVVGLQYTLERRKQAQAERAERLGEFLAATYAVSAGIEQIATAPSKDKVRVEADARSAAQDQLHRCLTKLRLLEDSDVVVAATYLERELTRITVIALGQAWTREVWRAQQRSELSRLTDHYEAIARTKLMKRKLEPGLGFYNADDRPLD